MVNKELKELARVIGVNQAPAMRFAEKMKGYMSQMMLMTANSGAFKDGSPFPAALSELHKQFVQEMEEDANMSTSMAALFSGMGPVARTISTMASTMDYAGVFRPETVSYTSIPTHQPVVSRKLVDDLKLFSYDTETYEPDRHPLREIIESAGTMDMSVTPMAFSVDPGKVPVDAFLSTRDLGKVLLGPYPSGVYPGFSDDPEVPMYATLIVRIHSKMHPGLSCLLVKHQTAPAHLFFYHPYEDFWIQWDGKTHFKHLQEELRVELNRVIIESKWLVTPQEAGMHFQSAQAVLQDRAKFFFERVHKLPKDDALFVPTNKGGQRHLGVFSQHYNTARIAAVCGNAVLVLYGTMSDEGKWIVMCNIIRPARRGVEIMEPVDPGSLDDAQRRALIQAAHFVIDHYTRMSGKPITP